MPTISYVRVTNARRSQEDRSRGYILTHTQPRLVEIALKLYRSEIGTVYLRRLVIVADLAHLGEVKFDRHTTRPLELRLTCELAAAPLGSSDPLVIPRLVRVAVEDYLRLPAPTTHGRK